MEQNEGLKPVVNESPADVGIFAPSSSSRGEMIPSQQSQAGSCPTCGREMHLKGPKAKGVETRTGAVQETRDYYYCSHCEQGLFPPRPSTRPPRKALE